VRCVGACRVACKDLVAAPDRHQDHDRVRLNHSRAMTGRLVTRSAWRSSCPRPQIRQSPTWQVHPAARDGERCIPAERHKAPWTASRAWRICAANFKTGLHTSLLSHSHGKMAELLHQPHRKSNGTASPVRR
jgi:hypothetical protein